MKVEIVLAGDVNPTPIPNGLLRALQLSQSPDLFLFTVDAAVASGPPVAGQTCISFFPNTLDDYRIAPLSIAVTASNHVTDFGKLGLSATLEALKQHGFLTVGSGLEIVEAEKSLFIDLPYDNGRLAILAFADTGEVTGQVGARAAGVGSEGVRALDSKKAEQAVRVAATEADWVWVVLHWGEEFVRYPHPEQRRTAWRLVDAGASLVVASHTHVPLGYERRGRGTIFYGLGNLVFPSYQEQRGFQYHWHPMARRGIVVCGSCENRVWTWVPRIIRHDLYGIPRLARTSNCSDLGTSYAANMSIYKRVYPWLRRRDRGVHLLQRFIFMSVEERVRRLEELFRASLTAQKRSTV